MGAAGIKASLLCDRQHPRAEQVVCRSGELRPQGFRGPQQPGCHFPAAETQPPQSARTGKGSLYPASRGSDCHFDLRLFAAPAGSEQGRVGGARTTQTGGGREPFGGTVLWSLTGCARRDQQGEQVFGHSSASIPVAGGKGAPRRSRQGFLSQQLLCASRFRLRWTRLRWILSQFK